MSNPSLKEQLQAISTGLSSAPKQDAHHKNISSNPPSNPRKDHYKIERKNTNLSMQNKKNTTNQKPAWLEQALYGVELLKAYYPYCFKEVKAIQPLKIGIKQDLVKDLSTREDIVIGDKSCMVKSLIYYVNSPAYHKSVVEGAFRIDLQGQQTSAVTAEEANYSAESLKAKLEKKQQKDKTHKDVTSK